MLGHLLSRSKAHDIRAVLHFLVFVIVIVTSGDLQIGAEASARSGGDAPSQKQTSCSGLKASSEDATPALERCIQAMPPGATLIVAPEIYHLRRPLTINRSVKIISAGLIDADGGCGSAIDGRCATFMLGPLEGVSAARGRMPIEIKAANVTFSHIRVVGHGGENDEYDRRICLDNLMRPLGGGIRVDANNFTIRKSVIRNVNCYTALEVISGSNQLIVNNNIIGPNGDHSPGKLWADGLTVHDSSGAKIIRNLFYDNTDVQLILGGCQGCLILGNRFRHSGSFEGGSFAELMLQSWPSTSGNFSQSLTRGNDIDCTPKRRCGYGMMIGSNPWYIGRASGGEVTNNRIIFAMIGLNVDELSGVMTVKGNVIKSSGGIFLSDCGRKKWPPINISPKSLNFLRGMGKNQSIQHIKTEKCLVNRKEN